MRTLGILTLALCVPQVAWASPVEVDVCVRHGHHGETLVEFHADHDSYVALYATYSDGSLAPIFPTPEYSHWVDAGDVFVVPVSPPCGVRLEAVQAVASTEWFDPSACWVASTPSRHWNRPAVVFAAARHTPIFTWGFDVSWRSHSARVVRSHWWRPRVSRASCVVERPVYRGHGHRSTWDKSERRLRKEMRKGFAKKRKLARRSDSWDIAWKSSGHGKGKRSDRAVRKSSTRSGYSGEPKRRSRS